MSDSSARSLARTGARTGAVAAALLLFCAAADAAPKSAPADPPAAQSQPGGQAAGQGAPIKPSHLAKARSLVVLSGISRSFAAVIPQFVEQIGASLAQTRPELAADLKEVLTNLRPEFEKLPDEMIDVAAQVFAQRLSELDVNAAVAFFSSAAGKDYVAAQPIVLSDIVAAMQGWQGKISTQMMTRVREEMKKKGHDV